MIARAALLAALVAGPLPALAEGGTEEVPSAADCTRRLDRSLAEMERRPLLKEELATGLMWLRLDAETARDAGDVGTCHAKAAKAEAILGIGPPER